MGYIPPFVKEMVKMWASNTEATPTRLAPVNLSGPRKWTSAALEVLLERRGKNFRATGKAKGFETSQDQMPGEGHYSDPQKQACYDERTLSLCSTAVLNDWERIQEPERGLRQISGLNRTRENHLLTSYKE